MFDDGSEMQRNQYRNEECRGEAIFRNKILNDSINPKIFESQKI